MSIETLDFAIPKTVPSSLPLLPLRKGVLLPGGVSPFAVGREKSKRAMKAVQGGLLLVGVQHDPDVEPGPSDLLRSATLAKVVRNDRDRRGVHGVVLQGIARVSITGFTSTEPYIEAEFEVIDDRWPETADGRAMLESVREHILEAAEKFGVDPKIMAFIDDLARPSLVVDAIAGMIEAPDQWRREVLVTADPLIRAEKVIKRYIEIRELQAARQSLDQRIRADNEDLQREAILRRQLKAINEELGEEDDELSLLKKKLDERDLPTPVREAVDRELKRVARLSGSPERSTAIDWLEWISDIPWNVRTGVEVDLGKLEAVLDTTHHGLEDVKRQVVEHLAVGKLGGKGRADVLLLVGPPGVGKTSIGEAIAEATKRELVRVALGGVRDEAELRGHRRTYVGSRPGRLIEGIRRAKTADPVVLLDEVDKLGRGWQGDPSAALLEILDPEQNHSFVDHYLEVPFDLSKVLFIATANDVTQVPLPLQDRMEILQIDGYTLDDKVEIARRHLFGKLARNAGVSADDVAIDDDAVAAVITGWTREAGVRQLQRVLGKIFRAVAVKKARDELEGPVVVTKDDLRTYLKRPVHTEEEHDLPHHPGIATGLAWTPMGGDVLYVEASSTRGSGKLTLTGQLGDVMKESAQAALTYVLSHGDDLGIDELAAGERNLHVHVPAGGVPKDGPSAGVTIFTALASLLSDRPVATDVAMTGEATLRGRVLPVGGIKSKVLAAHRKGLKRVILPRRNAVDLEELPDQARADIEFILVDEMSEVLEAALERPLIRAPAATDVWTAPLTHTPPDDSGAPDASN